MIDTSTENYSFFILLTQFILHNYWASTNQTAHSPGGLLLLMGTSMLSGEAVGEVVGERDGGGRAKGEGWSCGVGVSGESAGTTVAS